MPHPHCHSASASSRWAPDPYLVTPPNLSVEEVSGFPHQQRAFGITESPFLLVLCQHINKSHQSWEKNVPPLRVLRSNPLYGPLHLPSDLTEPRGADTRSLLGFQGHRLPLTSPQMTLLCVSVSRSSSPQPLTVGIQLDDFIPACQPHFTLSSQENSAMVLMSADTSVYFPHLNL